MKHQSEDAIVLGSSSDEHAIAELRPVHGGGSAPSCCARAAPGKSGLHARGEGERVLALESREGTHGTAGEALPSSVKPALVGMTHVMLT